MWAGRIVAGLKAVSKGVAVCALKILGFLRLVVSSPLFIILFVVMVTLTVSLTFVLLYLQSWKTWFTELPIVSGSLYIIKSVAAACGLAPPAQVTGVSGILGNNAAIAANMPNVTALSIFPLGADISKGVGQLLAIPVGAVVPRRGGAHPGFNMAIRTLEEVMSDEVQGHRSDPYSLSAAWDESWSHIRSVVSEIGAEEARFAEEAAGNALYAFRRARALQRELAETPVSHSIALRKERWESTWTVALWWNKLWRASWDWRPADEDGLPGPAARQVDRRLESFESLLDSVLAMLPDLAVALKLGSALEKDTCTMGNLLGHAVAICEGRVSRALEVGRAAGTVRGWESSVGTGEVAVPPSDIDVLGGAFYELQYFDFIGTTVCTEAKQAVNIFEVTRHSAVRLGEGLKAIKSDVFSLRGFLRSRQPSVTAEAEDNGDQRALWAETELVRLVPDLISHLKQTYFRQED
ncbi:hypothetical protein LY78DRAFT_593318 [Colletotrichum sublineola]|nr:hypothetical protein LY78DRAFT_593318 [Colletotrichum sublineola]